MKKSYLALGLVAAVAMSSCSNDEPMPNGNGNQNLAQGYEPVKLSMTNSFADVEVSGARTRGTGTVGSMDEAENLWQHENIYVLMTSTQDKDKDGNAEWGFTSALGNGPFLYEQFDGSFWARPTVSDNNISVLDYTLDRNEWWWGGSIDRFYPLQGASHFFAYHIDDAFAEGGVEKFDDVIAGDNSVARTCVNEYPTLTLNDTQDAYSIQFDLDGSQDLMAGYAPIPTGGYAEQDNGFSARSARQGTVPQISMKHLLSRLTFEVVKGGDNFDRVTLQGIEVVSKNKGEMVVAINPDFEEEKPWESVGNITWAESTESFALKQVPNKYLVDENGKTNGIYNTNSTNYDVYYNIYDGLYAYVDGTENVFFEGEDLAEIEAAVALDPTWVNDINTQDGHIVCGDNVSGYYWEKPIKVKTEIAEDDVKITTQPTLNTAAETSLAGGKAKLVEFADVDLKNFGLNKDDSKPVGEAMFVAPGVEEYTLSLKMAYLVRDGEAKELADLEQAVADAEAQVYTKEKELEIANEIVATRDAAKTAAQEAFDEVVAGLEPLEEALKAAQEDLYDAQIKEAYMNEKGSDEEKTAAAAAVAAAQTAVDAADDAIDDYKAANDYDNKEQALNDAITALEAAQDAVEEAEYALAAAEEALQDAQNDLAKFNPVVEEMVQTLPLKFTDTDPDDELTPVFEAGKSYNVKIVIYGYEPAEIKVELTKWENGGEFEVGGDEGNWDPNNPKP